MKPPGWGCCTRVLALNVTGEMEAQIVCHMTGMAHSEVKIGSPELISVSSHHFFFKVILELWSYIKQNELNQIMI